MTRREFLSLVVTTPLVAVPREKPVIPIEQYITHPMLVWNPKTGYSYLPVGRHYGRVISDDIIS